MANEASFDHRPVLLEATLQALDPKSGGVYLDCTTGAGGHTEAILQASGPQGRVIGIDRDPAALAAASARLASFGDRFTPIKSSFSAIKDIAAPHAPYDGILLDLGVSSPQLDHPERGFSFRRDGPVDMRMDTEQSLTATTLLDSLDTRGLVDILRRFGEEPRARRIATAIREGRPWTSTVALAHCVAESSGYRNSRPHPATRTLQALRMAVNDELGQLEIAMESALGMLAPGGTLCIISFHSLEDRMVKRRFRTAAGEGSPKDPYGNPIIPPDFAMHHRRGIAGKTADPGHPRSRSARLRSIQKLPSTLPQ